MPFDMGGTTAKICFIENLEPRRAREFEVDRQARLMKGSGLPLRIPVIEMVEVGAGGGSIARIDRLGRISVGPESAGAEPPAASGMGPGGVPLVQTRTDANSADGSQDGSDDDAEDTNISVGAMEERVPPEMLRKFDQIAGIYIRLDRLQEPRLERKRRGIALAPQTERRCAKLRNELALAMDGVH